MAHDVEQLLEPELEVAVGRVEHLDVLDVHHVARAELVLVTDGGHVVLGAP